MKPSPAQPVLIPTLPSQFYNSVGELEPDMRPIFEFVDVPDERAVNQHRCWLSKVKREEGE